MEEITLQQLQELSESEHLSLTLRTRTGEAEVSPRMYLTVNWNAPEQGGSISYRGYTVEGQEKTRRCKSYATMLAYLKKLGAVANGRVCVLAFNGSYETLAALRKEQAFCALTLQEVVEKYRHLADGFELVAPFGGQYSAEFPYTTVALSEKDGLRVIEQIKNTQKDALRERYERGLTAQQKAELPDFETLYAEICEESVAFARKVAAGEIGKGSPFLCDHVHEGGVKYATPHEVFWHFYHNIGFLGEQIALVRALMNNPVQEDLARELNDPFFAPLKEALLSVQPTFSWHCTMSGMLHRVFRFKLTDGLADWLKEHYTQCNERGFEDLAFYRGEKLLYSSCTHEGFHTDYSE